MFTGGIWSIVQRELRVTARRPLTHWLRVVGGVAGVFVFCSSAWNIPSAQVGPILFHGIHTLLMALIFIVVPALTADCISRERREDTLGLLFLTPLRPWQIVVGKVLAQALKAMTLWLAVAPVLTIPFLAGGIGWPEVVNCLCQELYAGMLAVAAGMVATSIAQKRETAFVLAYLFAALLCPIPTQQPWWHWGFPGGMTAGRIATSFPASVRRITIPAYTRNPGPVIITVFQNGRAIPYSLTYGSGVPVGTASITTVTTAKISPSSLVESAFVSLLILWAAIRFAGYCLRRNWKDRLPSVRCESLIRRYCSPVNKEDFAHGMRSALEWNPVFWLQQYSWQARLTTWTLCLGFVALGCAVSNGASSRAVEREWESRMLLILAAVYTYAGVNGFYQEKKSGALELLLVTPLSIDEIIFGRVFGLWKRFFPTALIISVWCLMTEYSIDYGIPAGVILPVPVSINLGPWLGYTKLYWSDATWALFIAYFTLPIFATFCALRVRNVALATACTWLMLLAAAVGGVLALMILGPQARGSGMLVDWGVLLGNAALVWFTIKALRHSLTERIHWLQR
jgi:ABC-type transport system involved in multi-copper enzyme maturation permease subunit